MIKIYTMEAYTYSIELYKRASGKSGVVMNTYTVASVVFAVS